MPAGSTLIHFNRFDCNNTSNFARVTSCADEPVDRCSGDPPEFAGAAFLPSAVAAPRPPGVQVMQEHLIYKTRSRW